MRIALEQGIALAQFKYNLALLILTGVYMFKIILKGSLILTLPILACSLHAHINSNKEILAKQCRELSQVVSSLVSSQQKNTCVDKLVQASQEIDSAADLIVKGAYHSAKSELEQSVNALKYAELNSCNRYIQISHSKFEAQRIKNAL